MSQRVKSDVMRKNRDVVVFYLKQKFYELALRKKVTYLCYDMMLNKNVEHARGPLVWQRDACFAPLPVNTLILELRTSSQNGLSTN